MNSDYTGQIRYSYCGILICIVGTLQKPKEFYFEMQAHTIPSLFFCFCWKVASFDEVAFCFLCTQNAEDGQENLEVTFR